MEEVSRRWEAPARLLGPSTAGNGTPLTRKPEHPSAIRHPEAGAGARHRAQGVTNLSSSLRSPSSKSANRQRWDEIAAVWLLLAIMGVAVVVSYTRLPPEELYNVTRSGLPGGLSRLLVDLNFPDAIIALGILAVVWPQLPRPAAPFAIAAAVLCLVVVVPGVVDRSDLDAKPINVLPALGVVMALVLSLLALRPPSERHVRGDALRLVLGALAIVLAIPWIAAALGLYLDGVPLLGSIFQTDRVVSYHGNDTHPAVHHGMHHGLYGMVLVLAALLLSRRLRDAAPAAAPLLALMLAYGIGNIVNDDWLEQVAERGWTDGTFPSVLEPGANWGWLLVLVSAVVTWALWFRQPTVARTGADQPRKFRKAS